MNRLALRDIARRRLDDTELPYAWSDAVLNDFINEALEEVSVRADLVRDTTTQLGRVNMVTDQAEYPLEPCEYLRIERVVMAGHGPLGAITRGELDRVYFNWESRGSGKPQYYITDDLPAKIALWPKPSADFNAIELAIELVVVACPMTNDNHEVPVLRVHQRNLVDWVLFRAYEQRDMDDYDKRQSMEAEARFTRNFGVRPSAYVLQLEQRGQVRVEPRTRYV